MSHEHQPNVEIQLRLDGRFVRLYQQLSPLTLHSHNRTELRRNCWKMALIVFYCVWCCWWFTMRNIKLLTIPNGVQKPTKFSSKQAIYFAASSLLSRQSEVWQRGTEWLQALECDSRSVSLVVDNHSYWVLVALVKCFVKSEWNDCELTLKQIEATYWETRNISSLMKVFGYFICLMISFFFEYFLSTHTQHISLIRWLLFQKINHWQTS